MKISVIGAGYLGATHAICMASLGHEVVVVDIDAQKISQLQNGVVPFFEPRLTELLHEVQTSRKLFFSTEIANISNCFIHFLCIGTPQLRNGLAADLSGLEHAFASVISVAPSGSIMVGKSTVPVGTAERLARDIESAGKKLTLNWNP